MKLRYAVQDYSTLFLKHGGQISVEVTGRRNGETRVLDRKFLPLIPLTARSLQK